MAMTDSITVPRHVPRRRWVYIAVLLLIVSTGHALTGRATHEEHVIHVLLRSAYLLPLLLGGLWYGTRGAIVTAGAVSILFAAHMQTTWQGATWENTNQLAMFGTYWIIGLTAGILTDLERRTEDRRRETEQRAQRAALVTALSALEAALKSRDEATDIHARAVAHLARAMAIELRLPPDRVELVYHAGLVHDLGKIGVRDDILLKPGRLSPAERERMHRHPGIAADILSAVPGTAELARIVRAHHEYRDGSGYPEGLRGEAIPLEAQIITVADVYCAVREDRPYHPGLSSAETYRFIETWTPSRLSEDIVAALRTYLRDECVTRCA